MFKIIMVIDGTEYIYGRHSDRNRANEIAIEVRASRQVETFVEEE